MGKLCRKYGSLEAAKGALKREFETTLKKFVDSSPPPAVLYHYCPEVAMRNILTSGVLWASDVFKVKGHPVKGEPEDITYGFDLIRSMAKYFVKGVADADTIRDELGGKLFIACQSADDSIADQWAFYADRGRGCAIGFDRKALSDLRFEGFGIGPTPVVYEPPVQADMLRFFLERATEIRRARNLRGTAFKEFNAQGNVYLAALAVRFKNQSFASEREWRLFVVQTPGQNRFHCHERDGDKGKIPTIDLPICTGETVTEVVLGPNCKMTEDEASGILETENLPRVRVRKLELATSICSGRCDEGQ